MPKRSRSWQYPAEQRKETRKTSQKQKVCLTLGTVAWFKQRLHLQWLSRMSDAILEQRSRGSGDRILENIWLLDLDSAPLRLLRSSGNVIIDQGLKWRSCRRRELNAACGHVSHNHSAAVVSASIFGTTGTITITYRCEEQFHLVYVDLWRFVLLP